MDYSQIVELEHTFHCEVKYKWETSVLHILVPNTDPTDIRAMERYLRMKCTAIFPFKKMVRLVFEVNHD